MVEWKNIGEIGSYFSGLTGKTKDDFQDGNAKFITYMNVFSNPSLDVNSTGVVKINEGEKQNKIQRGDVLFTGSSETPDEAGMSCVVTDDLEGDFYMNSFCFGLRLNTPDLYNLHFLKHVLRSDSIRKSIAKTAGILDTFTASIENLKEQITQRRNQFEHYRDQLLDLEGKEGVEIKLLENLAEIGTGSSNTQDELEKGKYPFYVRSQIVRWKDEYEFDETAIVTSGDGVGVGKVLHYVEGKYALHQRAYRIHIITYGLLPKFFFYYMQKTFYNYIMLNAYAASVTSVRRPMLLKYPVPIPTIEEQSRIVSILDTFEASIANLEAQLSQREKQYEYYRNKLLTFE
jgi:type I restriction enzyme S subunit